MAVVLPVGFLILQRATLYDGIRHVLFVIPMLAILAGLGLWALLPLLRRAPVVAAVAGGAYVGGVVGTLAVLHPLEYVAMNALAGGTRGAYGNFELDYWSAAATEALRRLECRLDYDLAVRAADSPPSIMICIPWREHLVDPILKRPWAVEIDPDHADFIIATERSRCADNKPVVLIDEVKRFDRHSPGCTRGDLRIRKARLAFATCPTAFPNIPVHRSDDASESPNRDLARSCH